MSNLMSLHLTQLRDHINTVHLNIRLHKCPKCDYVAGFKSCLLMHLKHPHLVCEHCSYVTTSKLKMGKHVKVGKLLCVELSCLRESK